MLLLWKLSTQNHSLSFVVTPYSRLQNAKNNLFIYFNFFLENLYSFIALKSVLLWTTFVERRNGNTRTRFVRLRDDDDRSRFWCTRMCRTNRRFVPRYTIRGRAWFPKRWKWSSFTSGCSEIQVGALSLDRLGKMIFEICICHEIVKQSFYDSVRREHF
jgi:hypothetical protein